MTEDIVLLSGNKGERYRKVELQIKAFLESETDLMANLANISAALKENFHFFWVGFYLVKEGELVLAPFQGPVACSRIAKGRGVCGTSWKEDKSILVPNVLEFPGHISCNALSRSEIVIPLHTKEGDVGGVLDVDSEFIDFFDAIDLRWLTRIAYLIVL